MTEIPVDSGNNVVRGQGQEEAAAIVRAEVLPEIKATIANAQELGAKKIAPFSHARAVEKLKTLDAFISVNPEAINEIDVRANDALFEANRLTVITQQAKQLKKMKPEEIALSMEMQLHTISRTLGAPDMRNHITQAQMDTLVSTIQELKEEHSMLSGTVKALETEMSDLKARYQEEIDTLNIQKASLENQSLEDRLSKERMDKERLAMEQRLASEKLFNQRYVAVRNNFLVDEADVFKKDHQLIIRLKAMHFPVGESTILAENYELLGKVQTAILTFEDPRVIVEGHTDATGSEVLNMELSMQRAEAVSQYLTTNRTLPLENISAVGYGSDHPLASNLTPAGRAMNRRIDVLIIPKTQSM